ncbi:MAG: SIMPL domain-containing protein [Candidatus Heimdallarchaeaceae archaeon]
MNTADENTNSLRSKFSFHPGKHFKLFIKGLLFVFFAGFVYTWVSSPTITTVTGSGEVSVPADSAIITFTLTSTNADPTLAVATVRDKVSAMSDMLTINWGVIESDIYESQVTVLPTDSGYQAATTVGLKTAQIPRVGDLVASLYKNDAAYVSQPVLSVENIDGYENEALNEAMKDAKAKANKLSFKNLKFIKKVVSIDQSVSQSTSTVSGNLDVEIETSEYAIRSGIIKIQKAVAVSYMMW